MGKAVYEDLSREDSSAAQVCRKRSWLGILEITFVLVVVVVSVAATENRAQEIQNPTTKQNVAFPQRLKNFNPTNNNQCTDLNLVSRSGWRARPADRERIMTLPVSQVVILHTVTRTCDTRAQCSRLVRDIQEFHLDTRGWWDIGYNFLVGGDGSIYEGRGWHKTGAFSINYNTNSIGVSFIGNFMNDVPTEKMLNAVQSLFRCGVEKGYLSPVYVIYGHRDVSCTLSPGDNLYKVIRSWSRYRGGRLPDFFCQPLPNTTVTPL